ncbi:MAG TPA: acyl-CoA dehydrogenase [Syntrophomonadaceae bacterium]|nr:acyl-CoA dehydrogenase [Syntrophomonadaceae bacterium]
MDFKKTDEQELLLESLDEFFQRTEFDENYIQRCEEEQVPLIEFRKAMIDAGFGMLGIPEEYGGMEVDTQTMIMVSEKISSYGFPPGLGAILQVENMLAFGSEEQKKTVMAELAEGKGMGFCLGISEPQAGSDNNAIATTATRRDGKVYINGHKTMITDPDRIKNMLCIVRDFDSPERPKKAMSMWMVPMDAPGVKIEIMHKVGNKTRSMADVYLEDVEVEEKDLVGVEGKGFLQLMKNFEVERLVLAAESLGMAVCAFNDAAKYATQRVQFGKTIGSFQLTQQKIVSMHTKIENMRNLLYKCAWEKDNGISINVSAAIAKLYCAQAAFEVCDDAMQIFGGVGYSSESRVSRLWRDARLNRIGGGTDEIMVYIAGRAIMREFADKR